MPPEQPRTRASDTRAGLKAGYNEAFQRIVDAARGEKYLRDSGDTYTYPRTWLADWLWNQGFRATGFRSPDTPEARSNNGRWLARVFGRSDIQSTWVDEQGRSFVAKPSVQANGDLVVTATSFSLNLPLVAAPAPPEAPSLEQLLTERHEEWVAEMQAALNDDVVNWDLDKLKDAQELIMSVRKVLSHLRALGTT